MQPSRFSMVAEAPARGKRETRPAPGSRSVEIDEALLAAARRALARHGPAHTTLERIADEAALSRVTLYRRGLTREAILAALADALLDGYREALWPALTGRGSAAERLRRALGAVCDVAEADREVLLALAGLAGGELEPEAHDEVLAGGDFAEPVERLLRDGAADGSLRGVDAPETAVAVLNQVAWTYVHLRAGPRWSARRARRITLDLALRGITVAAAKGRT